MKWSYNTVYLPAAELNENNKHFHLTDALNLLKTFFQPNSQGKSFYSSLWTEMGRERCLVIPINGHVGRMSVDIRHDLFPDFSPCDGGGGGYFHSYLNSHSHKKVLRHTQAN